MGEIFKSPIAFDTNKIPNESVTDYAFSLWRKHLPAVADKPWLVSDTIKFQNNRITSKLNSKGRHDVRKANSIQGRGRENQTSGKCTCQTGIWSRRFPLFHHVRLCRFRGPAISSMDARRSDQRRISKRITKYAVYCERN